MHGKMSGLHLRGQQLQVVSDGHSHNDRRHRSGAPHNDVAASYMRLIAKFYFNYAMLVVNSFGLQNSLESTNVDKGHFFARCHASAMACATVVRD